MTSSRVANFQADSLIRLATGASAERHYWDLSQELVEYIMMSYLPVENLYEDYDRAKLEHMDGLFEAYRQSHPGFNVYDFFMRTGFPFSFPRSH